MSLHAARKALTAAQRTQVPWFEPHHQQLFHDLPPPEENARPLPRGGGWWARRSWTALPQSSNPPPLRPHLGNFGASRRLGPYAREQWLRDKKEQENRNRFGGCGRGKKRDGDGEEREPAYLRTIKCRVRFVGSPAERNRQISILKSWMGSCRYTYNAALRGVRGGMPLKKEELRDRYVVGQSLPNSGEQPTTDEGWARKEKRAERKQAARGALGYETGALLRAKQWLKNTPSAMREAAVDDLIDAENANRKKAERARERGETDFQKWTLSTKERDDPTGWTVKVPHKCIGTVERLPRPTAKQVCDGGSNNPDAKRRTWTRITMFNRFECDRKKIDKVDEKDGRKFAKNNLGPIWLPEDFVGKFGSISHDCRLTRDRRGKFYLCIPVTTKLPPTVPEEEREPCALDPGVRVFQAVHSREGHGTYGSGDFDAVLEPLCNQLSKLQSVRDRVVAKWQDGQWIANSPMPTSWLPSVHNNTEHGALKSYQHVKRRLDDRMEKLRRRMECLVDEMHKRVSKDLCTRFGSVLTPIFETSKMAAHDQENGGRRKLLPKTVRALLGWSHYKFREKLKHKALMMGKEVIVVDESYTTIGCSRCGAITRIGGAKTFCCTTCGMRAPRDPKSARDILAKHVLSTAAGAA